MADVRVACVTFGCCNPRQKKGKSNSGKQLYSRYCYACENERRYQRFVTKEEDKKLKRLIERLPE